MGVEPISLTGHHFKWCAYTSSATQALRFFRETWGGIEPPHRAFAELRLTTWPPGLGLDFSFDLKARQFAGGFFRQGRFQNQCGGYGGYEICRG